jgi:hypothetical protein
MNWTDFALATGLFNTASKDWRRIQLFARSCELKEKELVATGSVQQLVAFNQDAIEMLALWINTGTKVAGNPWKYIFSDPFKPTREEVRKFAKAWNLSKEFQEAMG